MVLGIYQSVKVSLPRAHKRVEVFRRYLTFSAIANLTWEIAHFPLYTLWLEGSLYEIVFAIIHCTFGDLMIAFFTLALALMALGIKGWPKTLFAPVAILAVILGVGYTIFSEWNNVVVFKNWAYSEHMPLIPFFKVGLSPIAQWVIIPLTGLFWARRNVEFGDTK